MGAAGDRVWGIEIGGTKLQVIELADGIIQRRWRGEVHRGAAASEIRTVIEQGVASLLPAGRPAAVGVGFGGPVDWRSGTVARSHQVSGWEGFDLREWAGRIAGAPAVVENDSNVAALAEATLGAGRGFDPVFYTNMGSGVGGGLIVGGQIYHGLPPGEVEFGHLRLMPGGPTVEQRCSGWAVDRRIRQAIDGGAEGELARLCAGLEHGQAKQLGAALNAGDQTARWILEETAGDLAFALSHAVHLFHPGVIVLGGGLALVGEPLREAAGRHLPGYLMEAFRPGPAVRLAEQIDDAVPLGAALNAARALAAPAAGAG